MLRESIALIKTSSWAYFKWTWVFGSHSIVIRQPIISKTMWIGFALFVITSHSHMRGLGWRWEWDVNIFNVISFDALWAMGIHANYAYKRFSFCVYSFILRLKFGFRVHNDETNCAMKLRYLRLSCSLVAHTSFKIAINL